MGYSQNQQFTSALMSANVNESLRRQPKAGKCQLTTNWLDDIIGPLISLNVCHLNQQYEIHFYLTLHWMCGRRRRRAQWRNNK